MELVALLRLLWRNRLVVAAGVVVAMGVGFLFSKGATTRLGVASTRVVLDTPASQLIDVEPSGADTLGWRAALLADLMGGDAGRPRIAAAMRVPADKIAVVAPYLSTPVKVTPLSVRALEAAAVTPERYVVAIQDPDTLPIISIDTSAPSREEAARLATAASDALKQAADAYPSSPDLQDFVIDSVGPVRAREIADGPGKAMAAAVALVIVGLWCAGILLGSGLMRARREAIRIEPAAFRPRAL